MSAGTTVEMTVEQYIDAHGAGDAWRALPPSHRAEYERWVQDAVQGPTRERRLSRTVAMLRAERD